MRVIVSGLIAQYPLGGVAWDYVQYPAGLLKLGHDVFYVEDSGQWPYNPLEGGLSDYCDYNVEYLARVMTRFGLADRWAYCLPLGRQWHGKTNEEVDELFRTADAVLNVSGSLENPTRPGASATLIWLDSDPVFTQLKLARGQDDLRRAVDLHDVHFSFGEALPGLVPPTGHEWRPTRQPILLDQWEHNIEPRRTFTTVMNWTSYKPVRHDGREYGQKDVEMMKFIELPSRVEVPIELAINAGKTKRTPKELLAHRGWILADPDIVGGDVETYRHYLQESLGEWTVAKNGYVQGQPGWFSCRSACYLAAGRPVITQDTGFSEIFPIGQGLLTYSTAEESARAIASVVDDYDGHSRAARQIAGEYFDSDRVLNDLLARL